MTADERPSRSEMKRRAKAIEQLARDLVQLPEGDFREAPLEPTLREDFELARGLKASGALQRQLRHLAGVLRNSAEELEPLEEFLAQQGARAARETRRFHALEELRDALCRPDSFETALKQTAQRYPSLDLRGLRRLCTAVHHSNDKRAFREIFRRLREAQNEQAPGS